MLTLGLYCTSLDSLWLLQCGGLDLCGTSLRSELYLREGDFYSIWCGGNLPFYRSLCDGVADVRRGATGGDLHDTWNGKLKP